MIKIIYKQRSQHYDNKIYNNVNIHVKVNRIIMAKAKSIY